MASLIISRKHHFSAIEGKTVWGCRDLWYRHRAGSIENLAVIWGNRSCRHQFCIEHEKTITYNLGSL